MREVGGSKRTFVPQSTIEVWGRPRHQQKDRQSSFRSSPRMPIGRRMPLSQLARFPLINRALSLFAWFPTGAGSYTSPSRTFLLELPHCPFSSTTPTTSLRVVTASSCLTIRVAALRNLVDWFERVATSHRSSFQSLVRWRWVRLFASDLGISRMDDYRIMTTHVAQYRAGLQPDAIRDSAWRRS